MPSERNLLIVFLVALALVVGLSSFALRRPVTRTAAVNVEDLPTCSQCLAGTAKPSSAQCQDAGGTVRYRRSSECYSEPNVHDVCGFGVPCFTNGHGSTCLDVKEPYCQCEADAQCPDTFYCQFDQRSVDGKTFEPILETGECMRVPVDSTEPVQALKSVSAL